MNNKLQINIFSCEHRQYRFLFTVKMVNEICNIEHKDKIKLCIHAEKPVINAWINYFKTNKPNIEVQLLTYNDSNYLNRVRNAQTTECKYSCKLDDDVLISRHVWNYIIENLGNISSKYPIIAPILTNGIPTVELFVRDFLNETDKKVAYNLFKTKHIPANQWGLDYSEINKKIDQMNEWDGREYWDFVTNADTGWERLPVPWHYFTVRGVHPARFSFEYNIFIANTIFQNREKFFGKNDYSLEEYPAPYFTNNIFVCETDYWKYSLDSFEEDGWDEGHLTLRMMMDNAFVLYVKNGFGIHMAYGMTEGGLQIEKYYVENL